jgi:hypothetical protein
MMTKPLAFYLLLLCIAFSGCKQESTGIPKETIKTDEATEPFRVVKEETVAATEKSEPPILDEKPAELELQAIAIIKKVDPDVEKFYVKTLIGDLDQDGEDDLVMEYGIGAEGAMHHIYNAVRVFMQRPEGLQLLSGEVGGGYCADIFKIEAGKLYIDGLEACMIPFAKTIDFYTYIWNGTTMVESKEIRIEKKIINEIVGIQEEIENDDTDALEERFTDELKKILNGEKLDASNIKSTIDVLSPIMFMRSNNSPEPEKHPEDYAEADSGSTEYRLYVNYETDVLTTKINGKKHKVSAVVTLDGEGEYVFYLVNNKLYLSSKNEDYAE